MTSKLDTVFSSEIPNPEMPSSSSLGTPCLLSTSATRAVLANAEFAVSNLLSYLVSGLTNGAVYALVGVGFTLVYTVTRVFNFATGAFVMLPALTAAVLAQSGMSPWTILPILLGGGAVFGVAFELIAIRPVTGRGAPPVMGFISTLAVAIFLDEGASKIFGTGERSIPTLFDFKPVVVLGAAISAQIIVLWVACAIVAAVVGFIYYRTRAGVELRAVGRDRFAAELSGISVQRVIVIAILMAAVIGAIAAWSFGPLIAVSASMGLSLSINGFIAAILGGTGNPFGAFAGGFGLGLLQSLAGGYISTSLASVIAFIAVLVILAIRPLGLIKEKV